MDAKVQQILKTTGYLFKNKELLHRCITKSDDSGNRTDFQRLEFLGDKILNLTVSHLLFHLLPEANEGTMTEIATEFVKNGPILSSVAKKWELDKILIVGYSDAINGTLVNDRRLCDAVEALLGGVWLDSKQDFLFLCQFVQKFWNINRTTVLNLLESQEVDSLISDIQDVEEEQIDTKEENFIFDKSVASVPSSHMGKLKTISCSLQYKCKLDGCSNQYPCKKDHYLYTCCNQYSTNINLLKQTPCTVKPIPIDSFVCKHCNKLINSSESLLCTTLVHPGELMPRFCSNQYRCKLQGCSNKYTCKKLRYMYSCCAQYTTDLDTPLKGCQQAKHEPQLVATVIPKKENISNISLPPTPSKPKNYKSIFDDLLDDDFFDFLPLKEVSLNTSIKYPLQTESVNQSSTKKLVELPTLIAEQHSGDVFWIFCTSSAPCLLGKCTKEEPCHIPMHFLYQCCLQYHSNHTEFVKLPCRNKFAHSAPFLCHYCHQDVSYGATVVCSQKFHSGTIISATCSAKNCCNLLGCTTAQPCKQKRFKYTCCDKFVDSPTNTTVSGCRFRKHAKLV